MFRFDREISLGTVLHGLTIIGALMGIYIKLQENINVHVAELAAVESHVKVVERRSEELSMMMNKILDNQVKNMISLENLATRVDMLFKIQEKKLP